MNRAIIATLALVLAPLAAHAAKPPPPPTLKDLKRPAPEVRTGETVAPDPDRAKELYRSFLELEGGDPALRTEAMRRLGDLEIEAGDSARGETAGQGEAETREAIGIYTRLLEQQPDYPRTDVVLYQLSRGWEAVGDADKALAYLDRAGGEVSIEPPHRRGAIPARRDSLQRAALRRSAEGLRGGKRLWPEKRIPGAGALQARLVALQAVAKTRTRSSPSCACSTASWSIPRDVESGDPASRRRADRELVRGHDARALDRLFLRGRPETLDRFVQRRGEIPYGYMLYSELGDLLVEKQRYTDAADTYRAYVDQHPGDVHSPVLQMQRDRGLPEGRICRARAATARANSSSCYALGGPFWARARASSSRSLRELKTNLRDLAQHHHAEAQRSKKKAADYQQAARWYRDLLQSFPDDPDTAETNYLLADLLFESERIPRRGDRVRTHGLRLPVPREVRRCGLFVARSAYEREAKTMEGSALEPLAPPAIESELSFA